MCRLPSMTRNYTHRDYRKDPARRRTLLVRMAFATALAVSTPTLRRLRQMACSQEHSTFRQVRHCRTGQVPRVRAQEHAHDVVYEEKKEANRKKKNEATQCVDPEQYPKGRRSPAFKYVILLISVLIIPQQSDNMYITYTSKYIYNIRQPRTSPQPTSKRNRTYADG